MTLFEVGVSGASRCVGDHHLRSPSRVAGGTSKDAAMYDRVVERQRLPHDSPVLHPLFHPKPNSRCTL